MVYTFGVYNTQRQNIKKTPPYGYPSIKNPYTINFVPRKFYTRARIVKSADFTTNTDNALGAGTSRAKMGGRIFQNLKNSLIARKVKRKGDGLKFYKSDSKNLTKKMSFKKKLLEAHAEHMLEHIVAIGKMEKNSRGTSSNKYKFIITGDFTKKITFFGKIFNTNILSQNCKFRAKCVHPYPVENAADNYIYNFLEKIRDERNIITLPMHKPYLTYYYCISNLTIYMKCNLCTCPNIRIRICLKEGADNLLFHHMNSIMPTIHIIRILSKIREQGYKRRQWKWTTEPRDHNLGKNKMKSDNLKVQNNP